MHWLDDKDSQKSGYSLEVTAERYYRDFKLYQIGEGAANIMSLIIADNVYRIQKSKPAAA